MITEPDRILFLNTFGVKVECFKGILNTLMPIEETGIDIVAFDKWVSPNANESCAQAVERKYGADAVELVRRVL